MWGRESLGFPGNLCAAHMQSLNDSGGGEMPLINLCTPVPAPLEPRTLIPASVNGSVRCQDPSRNLQSWNTSIH